MKAASTERVLPKDEHRGRLLRILGVGFGLAVTIGGTIGMGILRTPGEIAIHLPNAWLFLGVWVLGGIYALLGAISVAELGTMIPRSGGFYVFAHRALGSYAGFVVGWSDWLSTCGTIAVIGMVIAEYTSVLIPALSNQKAIALLIVALFTSLQWHGVRWGSNTQNITSLLKALVFVALIIACFTGGQRAINESAIQPIVLDMALLAALVKALQGVLYTYDGWYGVIYFGEEVRDPARDVPRSMIWGVVSVIIIYLLVNVALLLVMPLSEMAGKELAVGHAAQTLFGERGDTIIRVLAIVSMLSTINAYHLTAPRILLAMSRDQLFTRHADQVNRGGTPNIALLISALAAATFILGGDRLEQVLAVLAFFFVINYSVSFLSVFVLRVKEPDTPRPYKAWGYPWTTGLALAGSIAFLAGAVITDINNGVYENSIYALVLLALSYPVFLLLRLFGLGEGER